jgi:hypothetical protein
MDRELEFFKEKIIFYRLLLTLSATAFFAVLGWSVATFGEVGVTKSFLGFIGFFCLAFFNVSFFHEDKVLYRKIKELNYG